jgi:hypothetical protein
MPSLFPSTQITELRQKLADLQKQVTDLEAEREQKQRDFDRKLLLAKSKIEMEEASVTAVPVVLVLPSLVAQSLQSLRARGGVKGESRVNRRTQRLCDPMPFSHVTTEAVRLAAAFQIFLFSF